jgi:hypothetical protein
MSAGSGLASRDHGAAAVRGWVELYTRGLPAELRDRRCEEVEADLADETLDAERSGSTGGLRAARWSRLIRGIPADVSWRLGDGRRAAPSPEKRRERMPASRLSLVLLAGVAILAGIGLVLSLQPLVTLGHDPDRWQSWGPYGFAAGATAVIVGSLVAVWRPVPGAVIALTGALVGALASPWLLMFWLLVPIAVAVRLYVPAAPKRPGDAA